MEHQEGDWHEIRVLDTRVQQGMSFELTEDVCGLLQRTAPTVAISEAEVETALTNVESAMSLLHRMRERIRDGSNRIVDALDRMSRLRKKGDIEGARQQMREVLAVEVVPHYREIAEGQLAEMDELS
ncbi:DUSAM domain-containing protein [Stigmatella sp. ncwal1]|uniref:DUSAM domain-containing protein n=1 Tax=Stigmatella ashevillensis TaxID=2995309 RepID=A0ABT5DCI2_9BACT|nr:DUSAM domain-containing protein [Stigmatella ashevillena]MDC0710056.1 DUSAM domain-containing protein [Stigmatella ashevillena]